MESGEITTTDCLTKASFNPVTSTFMYSQAAVCTASWEMALRSGGGYRGLQEFDTSCRLSKGENATDMTIHTVSRDTKSF